MTKEIMFAALRRLGRNFISAFAVTFTLSMYGFKEWDSIRQAFLIDFVSGLQVLWIIVLYPTIIAGMFAGLSAAGKLLRDILRENGFENLASKIIF